jgi:hypothetical protein
VVVAVMAAIAAGAAFLIVEPHVTSTRARACSAAFAEPIDPLSSQHLLPGAAEPPYSTDPPTSGAHKPGIHPTGALTEPIERAIQVSLLEQGDVLIQYRGVSTSARHQLNSLAGGYVTVAPNSTLPEPIVATAWLWKMTCSRVDTKALRDFGVTHRLEVPKH